MSTTAYSTVCDNYYVQSIALSDEVLFEEMCINGNERAFNLLVAKYHHSLILYAQTISNCRMEAEEIVNDVFLKFWSSKDKINHYLSVKYYLKVSVRNRAIDLIRKNKKYKKYVVQQTNEELSMLRHQNFNQNALDEICSSEVCNTIECVVNKIPPKAKQIFLMSRNEGMRYKEIAEKLNISVKTVETQMTRSLAMLRKEIAI
jgi:RNA polymerase sigma-70 factor (ECF subfamily)